MAPSAIDATHIGGIVPVQNGSHPKPETLAGMRGFAFAGMNSMRSRAFEE
jgi:hypothetical protein